MPSARSGFYIALLTALTTILTFGVAITALPNSGAGCVADCFEYPYLDTLSAFPGDYLWMPLATVQVIIYLMFVAVIHHYAPDSAKLYSLIALSLAIVVTVILAGAYFVQFSVVPISLMNEETEGITLLTQYNPHGIFIVLEEFGYLLMGLSFVFLAPVFARKDRLQTAIQWIFIAGFVLILLAFTLISTQFGLDRLDRFEIAAISIDWLVLIINGILVALVFRRQSARLAPA
jgi:hypothetical protein